MVQCPHGWNKLSEGSYYDGNYQKTYATVKKNLAHLNMKDQMKLQHEIGEQNRKLVEFYIPFFFGVAFIVCFWLLVLFVFCLST